MPIVPVQRAAENKARACAVWLGRAGCLDSSECLGSEGRGPHLEAAGLAGFGAGLTSWGPRASGVASDAAPGWGSFPLLP